VYPRPLRRQCWKCRRSQPLVCGSIYYRNRHNGPKNEPTEKIEREIARGARPHVERVMLVLSKNVPIRQDDVTLRRRRLNPTLGSWILIDVSFQTSLPRGPGYHSDVEQWKDSSHVTPRRGRTRPSGILIFLSLCYTRVSAFLCAGQCNTSPLLRTVEQERVWQLSDTFSHALGHWRRANAAKLTPRLRRRVSPSSSSSNLDTPFIAFLFFSSARNYTAIVACRSL